MTIKGKLTLALSLIIVAVFIIGVATWTAYGISRGIDYIKGKDAAIVDQSYTIETMLEDYEQGCK